MKSSLVNLDLLGVERNKKISSKLLGHTVSKSTREKISNSLKEYNAKNGDDQKN